MGSLSKWLIVTSALIGSLTGALAQTAQSINTQLLAQAPVPAVQLATRHDDALKVDFIKADLDGSGKFQFIVAFYSLENDGQGIFLRVFQQQATGLLLVGEQEDKVAHGGYGISVHLVDINGDGIPEIEIEGHQANGAQILHQYFTWTGHSLHSSLDAIADSSLEDIDGDGIQELVASNGDGSFNLYKYNGTDFSLLKTVDHDPDGAIGPDGKVNIVRAHLSELRPHVFELNDILALTKDNGDGGRIRFIIGNLRDLNGKLISVTDIDTTTLMLVRNLRPLHSRIRPAEKNDKLNNDDDHGQNSGQVLELEFARRDVLQLLPRLKLTAPLVLGDRVQLLLFGKLRNGTRASATTIAVIDGNSESRYDEAKE